MNSTVTFSGLSRSIRYPNRSDRPIMAPAAPAFPCCGELRVVRGAKQVTLAEVALAGVVSSPLGGSGMRAHQSLASCVRQ
jgi:hypothetical protein